MKIHIQHNRRVMAMMILCLLVTAGAAFALLESLLDPDFGGELTANGSIVWSADNATDNDVRYSSAAIWLCRYWSQPNYLLYRFKDTDNPGEEREETFNRFDYYNYGNTRSISKFQIFGSSDPAAKTDWLHSSWQRAVPAVNVRSTDIANLLWRSSETDITWHSYYHPSYPADNARDGQYGSIWLGRNYPNHIIFRLNGGQPVDAIRFGLRNYGNHTRSIRYFRIATSNDPAAATDPNHSSWTYIHPRPGEGSQDPVNHLQPSLGCKIEYVRQQTWPVNRINDGNIYYIFLGYYYPNHVIFSFDPNYNNGGSPLFNKLSLSNYGTTRSLKHMQLFFSSNPAARTDPGHSSWVKIQPRPGDASTDPLNLITPLYGGKLEYYNHQLNSGYWAASHSNDNSTGTYWLSYVYPHKMIYSFRDTHAEDMNKIELSNYSNNHGRSVRNFQILYSSNPAARTDPEHPSWTLIPPNATQGSDDLVDFASMSYGGRVEYVTRQHNSYPASRIIDERAAYVFLTYALPCNLHLSLANETASTIDHLSFMNYTYHNRALKDFMVYTSADPACKTDPNHASWSQVVPPAAFKSSEPLNLIAPINGGKREYNDVYTWHPDRVTDGSTYTSSAYIWLSYVFPNSLIYSFSGEAAETFNKLRMSNYGTYGSNNRRSTRHFQIFWSNNAAAKSDPYHASWTAITPNAGQKAPGKADLLFKAYGGVRTYAPFSTWTVARVNDQRHRNRNDQYAIWLLDTLNANCNTPTKRSVIFSLGNPVQGGGAPAGEVVDTIALNNYGNNNRSVKDFEVFWSNDAAAAADPNHASWQQVTQGGAPATFTAANTLACQSFSFDAANGGAPVKYLRVSLVSNYGDRYVGLRELYAYGTKSLEDCKVWLGVNSASWTEFTFGNITAKYFMFRMNNSFADEVDPNWTVDDPYGGARELELAGPKTMGDMGAWHLPNTEGPHQVDLVAPIAGVKYLRLRLLSNYGDYYTGLRMFRATGTVQAKTLGVWKAENTYALRTYDFPATVNGKYFQFRSLQSYGSHAFSYDRYIGGREIKLYGTKTLGSEGVFQVAKPSTYQHFSFDDVTAKYFRIQFNESYGDRYCGLREAELYGTEILEDRAMFGAPKDAAYHEWYFNGTVTAPYFRFSVERNYGNYWIGMRDLYLYGTRTEGDYGVFAAEQPVGWKKAYFEELTGKYFQLRTLASYGNAYGGMREIRLLRSLHLTLADTDSGADETMYTNDRTIKFKLTNVDTQAAKYALSEDPNFSGAIYTSFTPGTTEITGTFVLSAGDGQKTVYAKVLDTLGQDFTTASDDILLDTDAPGPVTNLSAEAGVGEVTLTWRQATDQDLHGTVVRFSTTSFPMSQNDGQALPNGAGGFFYDAPGNNVIFKHEGLTNGTTYYYSFFSFDQAENYSSRMTISAMPKFPVDRLEIQTAAGSNSFDPQVAGKVLQIRVVAFDEHSQRVETYEGAKQLYFSSQYVTPASGSMIPVIAGVTLPGNVPVVFTKGISQPLALKYMDAGRVKLMAVDQAGTPGDPADDYAVKVPPVITFVPVGFDLQWAAPATQPFKAGEGLQLTIRAVASDGSDSDLSNNPVTPNYVTAAPQGIVLSTSYVSPTSGKLKVSPEATAIKAQGQATLAVKYMDAGKIRLSAEDTAYFSRSIKGDTGETEFVPASLELTFDPYPKKRGFFFAAVNGEPWGAKVRALATDGAVTENYRATVSFDTDGREVSLPDDHEFAAAEKGVLKIPTGFRARDNNDPMTIVVLDNAHATVKGEAQVSTLYPDARIVVKDAKGPVGTLAFQVELRQGFGKGELIREDVSTSVDIVIAGESGTKYPSSARISLDSRLSPRNLSSGKKSLKRVVLLEGGHRTVYIADVEAEDVKISVIASVPELNLTAESTGTMTFTANERKRRGMVVTETQELKNPE